MAAAAAEEFYFTLSGEDSLGPARRALAEWLGPRTAGEPAEALDDVIMAVGELAANSLRAARSKAVITARKVDGTVLVDVTDDGAGIGVEVPEDPPSPMAESGRGLYVVRRLVDVLWIRTLPEGGTKATFARRLTAAS